MERKFRNSIYINLEDTARQLGIKHTIEKDIIKDIKTILKAESIIKCENGNYLCNMPIESQMVFIEE